jgi:hypothetical protein
MAESADAREHEEARIRARLDDPEVVQRLRRIHEQMARGEAPPVVGSDELAELLREHRRSLDINYA